MSIYMILCCFAHVYCIYTTLYIYVYSYIHFPDCSSEQRKANLTQFWDQPFAILESGFLPKLFSWVIVIKTELGPLQWECWRLSVSWGFSCGPTWNLFNITVILYREVFKDFIFGNVTSYYALRLPDWKDLHSLSERPMSLGLIGTQ